MNDFLHMHIPCGDEDIEAIEKFLSEQFGRPIKFQRVNPEVVPADKVEVCPMSDPDPNFIENVVGLQLKYKHE